MKHACKISLGFITTKKKRAIKALLQAYRASVNFYIKSLWKKPGKLNKETLDCLQDTRLSQRYKSQTLKQALEIVIGTKKSAKALGKSCSLPVFTGPAILDGKFISIEPGHKSFDLILKLSCLKKRHKIIIPTRKTRPINKWLAMPGAEFIQGVCLSENSCSIWVKCPDTEPRKEGETLGIDIGINKLIADSAGNFFGVNFKKIRDKILKRKPGSKSRKKSYKERTNYINQALNKLPWKDIKVLGIEKLSDMKRGKRKNRGRHFRKAMAPWTYRQVLNRIKDKAQENSVRLVCVPPVNTSRICPNCGMVSEENRKGEHFRCVACDYSQDSDYVGALNVLVRTQRFTGSVESPVL